MLYCGDVLDVLPHLERYKCLFADVPDNLGLQYAGYDDNLSHDEYVGKLEAWFRLFVSKSDVV